MFPTHKNVKAFLGRIAVFAGLSPEHLESLVATSRSAHFKRNQAIYLAGETVEDMYFLLSGQVKLALSSTQGQEKVINLVGPGRSFGEAELFGGHGSLATATSVTASQVLCIAGAEIRRIMAVDPSFALRLMRLLAQRQLELDNEMAARYFRTGSQRLLDHFVRLAGPSRAAEGETQITLSTTKHLLASRFDMKPETLSRALRDLSGAGLIAVDGSRVGLINARIDHYLAHEDPGRGSVIAADQRLPGDGESTRRNGRGSGPEARPVDAAQSYCHEINRAGRQRMLSQRMVKSWLMLKQRVLPRPARRVLTQSIELFDRQLAQLEIPANSAKSGTARAELAEVWRPYRVLLDAEPSRKTAHALYGMNEEVLKAAHALTMSFETADGTQKGKLVNQAGRQRMLSQRIAKFFLFQQAGIQVTRCRTELDELSEEFEAALAELGSATRNKPAIAAELDSAAAQWQSLLAAIAARDANPTTSARKVFNTSEGLLQSMDTVVELCATLPD